MVNESAEISRQAERPAIKVNDLVTSLRRELEGVGTQAITLNGKVAKVDLVNRFGRKIKSQNKEISVDSQSYWSGYFQNTKRGYRYLDLDVDPTDILESKRPDKDVDNLWPTGVSISTENEQVEIYPENFEKEFEEYESLIEANQIRNKVSAARQGNINNTAAESQKTEIERSKLHDQIADKLMNFDPATHTIGYKYSGRRFKTYEIKMAKQAAKDITTALFRIWQENKVGMVMYSIHSLEKKGLFDERKLSIKFNYHKAEEYLGQQMNRLQEILMAQFPHLTFNIDATSFTKHIDGYMAGPWDIDHFRIRFIGSNVKKAHDRSQVINFLDNFAQKEDTS